MDNANRAFLMAFGMIVAVLILAAVSYVFSNLRVIPEGDDSAELVEQASAFNLEYEVYDKKIMYGVDVISVLNKAKSNNDKYVQGNFFSGQGYNTDYIIDIVVILKTPLEEKVVVTYLEDTWNGVVERDYSNNEGPSILANTKFKKPSNTYSNLIYTTTSLWSTLKLQSNIINTKVRAGTYHLLSDNAGPIIPGKYTNRMIDGDSEIKSLLEQSAQMSQTVKNTSNNKMIVYTAGAGAIPKVDIVNTGWNRATWYPAIYDLKTRKFKCLGDNIVYSKTTGRIIQMTFEEI